ncbi:MAG TPA: circularly permuted type 2 ATP-grasp protein [Steroidobacteraceae bacterium]|jgi:uncharacterized circularly permuted ATP-grasp superfamily protein
MRIAWNDYPASASFDELIGPGGAPRPAASTLIEFLSVLGSDELATRQKAADVAIRSMGITFTVYHEEGGSIDRAWPLDIIPRVIALDEWRRIEAGLQQRSQALNLFIDDIYHEQRIVRDGVFPRGYLADSVNFRPQCVGVSPPQRIWAHVCGSDLVRGADGTVYVLEDNLRVPSGVSYMLENRQVVKRVFPEVFAAAGILPVDDYPSQLFDMLCALAPAGIEQPEVVVLTPGIYNSAYFEHSYLAQQMGCELVEGRDLVVGADDIVYMRTIIGWQRVDVIYRRVDDLFLDPEEFRADSTLGVPGLMRAWRAGNVALANAPGAGVADDKLVYTFVPAMIRYYLDQDAILPNVPSFLCAEVGQCQYVLANLASLVVKPANESGGYGMLMGPRSSAAEQREFAQLIQRNPRNYIAQPVISLSTTPTLVEGGIEPRHLDLRPFILAGRGVQVTTGGLTRVAMRKGSLVVNSSQGGGSKDTWIVDTGGEHAVARR